MPDNQAQTPLWTVHDSRRGEIIWILKSDYPKLVTFKDVQNTLRDRNVPVGKSDLYKYFSYLEEAGYIRCDHRYNEDESRDEIWAAALTAKGMQLYDRKISDPGVRL